MIASRSILIVGGSGGIGAGIARQCAAAGAWPLVGYYRRQDAAKRVVEQCRSGEAIHLDLALFDAESLAGLAQVDTVVFAAGVFQPQQKLLEICDKEIRWLLDVNMLSPIRLIRSLIEAGHVLRDVIFILSTASFGRGNGPYALSKIGELAVCKILVSELNSRGIRVNAIAPGWTETSMAREAANSRGQSLAKLRADHLDGHLVQPEQLGDLCVELLSDPAPEHTGRLAVLDRRESRDPVWLNLETVFSADELAWTMPSTIVSPNSSLP